AVAGEGAVWVGRRRKAATAPDSVLRVDPGTNRVAKELVFGEEGVQSLDVGGGAVWITNSRRDRVSRLSVRTGVRESRVVGRRPRGVAFAAGRVWTANYDDGTVTELSQGLDRRSVQAVGPGPTGIAGAGGALWVTNFLGGTVTRIDAETGRVEDSVAVGRNPFAVVARGDLAWVTNYGDGTVTRIRA
ncbi:MAG: hypothetical protein HZB46_02665, partial [Solirubrobacterales bacterium]|nr:hypothetical protein [Solirubrobacterales bacterium]